MQIASLVGAVNNSSKRSAETPPCPETENMRLTFAAFRVVPTDLQCRRQNDPYDVSTLLAHSSNPDARQPHGEAQRRSIGMTTD